MDGENGKKAIVYNMREEKKDEGHKKKTKGKKRKDKELSTLKS